MSCIKDYREKTSWEIATPKKTKQKTMARTKLFVVKTALQ